MKQPPKRRKTTIKKLPKRVAPQPFRPDTKMICKPCLVAQLSGMDGIDVNMAKELLTAFGRAEMVSGHAVTDAVASYDRQAAR
jgi:hypothetical protein